MRSRCARANTLSVCRFSVLLRGNLHVISSPYELVSPPCFRWPRTHQRRWGGGSTSIESRNALVWYMVPSSPLRPLAAAAARHRMLAISRCGFFHVAGWQKSGNSPFAPTRTSKIISHHGGVRQAERRYCVRYHPPSASDVSIAPHALFYRSLVLLCT